MNEANGTKTGGRARTHLGVARARIDHVLAAAQAILEWGQLTRMAAAMSYRTIFGLIPVLVIGLVVLGSFATPDQVSDVISRLLRHAGISEIVVEEPPPEEKQSELTSIGGIPIFMMPDPGPGDTGAGPAPSPAPAPGPGKGGGPAIGPDHPALPKPIEGAARLDDWINALVQRVRSIPFTAIGLVGLAALIYAAISMLAEVEGAFNQIYRVSDGRSWIRRVPLYWSLLTLGSLLLVASFFVGERLTNWVEHLSALQVLSQWRAAFIRGVAFVVTVGISTLLLLIVYLTVPNTRVKVLPALAGAILAAVLWETGKWGFTRYVHFSANYSRLYGSIGLIPLFLLWVYVTWMIVLFGLRLCYLLQYGGRAFTPGTAIRSLFALPATAEGIVATPLVDPTAVLAVMADAAARFTDGKPAYCDDIARTTKIAPSIVGVLLDRLAEAGLLHRVDTGDEGVRYTLARPADTIRASDLIRLGHDAVERPESSASAVLARMRQAQCEAVAGLTLADVLAGSGKPARSAGEGPAIEPAPARA
ncbi:MAG: YihY family inner membrane protein [Phycisphaerales bacterium]|nr:YihY family inner membrane protein [Phycisphaerales bacterium]